MLIAVDDQATVSVMDESLPGIAPGSLNLHILCRDNGWDAGIYHPAEQRWLGVHSGKKNIFSDAWPDWMNLRFGHTHFTLLNRHFTLVPKVLYEEKNALQYLDLGCGKKEELRTFTAALEHLPAMLVFGIPSELTEKASLKLSTPEYHHQGSFTLDTILGKNKNSGGKKVHLQVFEDILELMVSEGNQLLLYNVFPFQLTDEAVYHVMNAYEVLQMNPESVPLTLGGQAGKNSAVYALLYKYIRHVNLFGLTENRHFAYQLSELPAYRFHALYSQCAL